MTDFAVVVLAGGEGRRIGGQKPQRLLGARSLLDRAIDRARAWSDCVAVSVHASRAQTLPDNVSALEDTMGVGPVAGIAAALDFAAAMRICRVLTIPCDCPFLPDDLPIRLLKALERPVEAAIALSAGQVHPACGLWRTGADAGVRRYISDGGASLRGLIVSMSISQVEWSTQPVDPFFNINTVADLTLAHEMLGVR